jgi:hypothetical protein
MWSAQLVFFVFFYVGCAFRPWPCVILLHFSHYLSKSSSTSFSSTTFQNFQGVSDPLSEVFSTLWSQASNAAFHKFTVSYPEEWNPLNTVFYTYKQFHITLELILRTHTLWISYTMCIKITNMRWVIYLCLSIVFSGRK